MWISILSLIGCVSEDVSSGDVATENPPVILISIDTLRSDHLPAYGYESIKTPAIDSIRSDGVLFRNAYSQAPTTLPSHASIFTGLLPPRHGVRNNLGYSLDPDIETIATLLSSAGYETGAAVSAYVLRSETGISSGFDFYDDVEVQRSGTSAADLMREARETNRPATDWISRRQAPFFFFLHYFEPHHPYDHGGYDGEIEAADAALGEFLDFLHEQDLYEESLIIVLSDHGEGLGDHGEPYHGVFVYRESIQVPLIVKMPNNLNRGEEVAEARSLVDVMPTIMEIAGVRLLTEIDGRSLFRTTEESIPVYSESLLPRIHFGWSELRSVISGGTHVIEAPRPEVYDLIEDPLELDNLIDERRRDYAAAREVLSKIGAGIETPAVFDREQRDRLAALGYIGSGGQASDPVKPDPKDQIGQLNLLLRGSELQSKGDCRGALAVYGEILEMNPGLTDAWARSAECLEVMGQLRRAIDAYRRSLELSPQLAADYALALARLFLRTGELDEAARHAELAVDGNPGDAQLLLGNIALRKGNLVEAERVAERMSDHEGRRGDAAVLRARVMVARGDMTRALEILDEWSPTDQESVRDYFLTRGDVLARLDRFDDARESFEKEIELFPGNLGAYTSLAMMEFVRGRSEEAERVLHRMVTANPGESARRLATETIRIANAGRVAEQ